MTVLFKYNYILLLFFCTRYFSPLCDFKITKEKIDFGGCYSGLTINKLRVFDTAVSLYPRNFIKISAFVLLEKQGLVNNDFIGVQLYFEKPHKNFQWRVYDSVMKGDTDDLYDFPHQERKVLGNIFKRNTWYLFNFHYPHFRIFVYCDNNKRLSLRKQHLNANF
jgi:hypothetical protein